MAKLVKVESVRCNFMDHHRGHHSFEFEYSPGVCDQEHQCTVVVTTPSIVERWNKSKRAAERASYNNPEIVATIAASLLGIWDTLSRESHLVEAVQVADKLVTLAKKQVKGEIE